MPRVHNSLNLIYSVGTQVVSLREVQGAAGPEKGCLEAADVEFHEREYQRLVAEWEAAAEQSTLPERAEGKAALNDLLVRLRIRRRTTSKYDYLASGSYGGRCDRRIEKGAR